MIPILISSAVVQGVIKVIFMKDSEWPTVVIDVFADVLKS